MDQSDHDTWVMRAQRRPVTSEAFEALERAAAHVQGGGLLVVPTDTVYGIGALASDPAAVARLLAAKGRGRQMPPPVLVAGGVRMDVERHEVRVDGEVVAMPLREFELLELFLRHPGRVLTRSQILERLWGPDYEGDTKTLDVHIKRLRGRIEVDASKPVLITTVRGLGYRLDGDSEH